MCLCERRVDLILISAGWIEFLVDGAFTCGEWRIDLIRGNLKVKA